MQHVAIMKKSWGLTGKILTGQKTIESRWYKSKVAPWDRIKKGETIYFKNAGEPVFIKAKVKKVLKFSDLTPKKVGKILDKYSAADGIEKDQINAFYNMFRDKSYCLLIFLKNAKRVQPFLINKQGYGMMSAWICIEDVNKIRIAQPKT